MLAPARDGPREAEGALWHALFGPSHFRSD